MKGLDRTNNISQNFDENPSTRISNNYFLIIQKIFLIFLATTIVSISISKSVIMFKATYLYMQTGVPWFEWLNYLILSLAVLILPILMLFFLDSIHVRRLLRIYLFGITFTNAIAFYEDVFSHLNTIFLHDRPLNPILIFIEALSALFCWLFLLRQINGRSLLPIQIKTKIHKSYSGIEYMIKNPIINIINFVFKPKAERKKTINTVCLLNLIIFSGLLITMIPENSVITLQRPEDHDMKIWFWTSDPADYNNETLDIMAANNIGIKIWQSYTDPEFYRFADRNIDVVIVSGFPTDECERDEKFNQFKTMLDYWDAMPNCPFVGVVDDMEHLAGVSRYNKTWYDGYVEYVRNCTEYITSRGYEVYITEWLASNNDYRDGDVDVSVVYKNPFDPVEFENISSIDWMVYRSEKAISYDEPYPYFTYQWASQINDYMEYLDENFGYTNGFWKNKSSMSIGVTSTNTFYTFNKDFNPDAKEQFFTEMAICHACEIAEVSIFIAQKKDNALFELIGGASGLQEMLDYIDSYNSVDIVYKRRATFFGNLKLLSNITGSIFGLFYSDVLYDFLTGFLVFLWVTVFILSSIYIFKKFNIHSNCDENQNETQNGTQNEKQDKNQKNKEELATEMHENREESKSDRKSIVLRLGFISMISAVFILTAIFFYQPELFVTLANIERFL